MQGQEGGAWLLLPIPICVGFVSASVVMDGRLSWKGSSRIDCLDCHDALGRPRGVWYYLMAGSKLWAMLHTCQMDGSRSYLLSIYRRVRVRYRTTSIGEGSCSVAEVGNVVCCFVGLC